VGAGVGVPAVRVGGGVGDILLLVGPFVGLRVGDRVGGGVGGGDILLLVGVGPFVGF